jgi:hypothetical protein
MRCISSARSLRAFCSILETLMGDMMDSFFIAVQHRMTAM